MLSCETHSDHEIRQPMPLLVTGDDILRDRCGGSSGEVGTSGAKATILIPV
jgi:hypothetical protein